MYHAPLLIYLFIGEQQGVAPVVQNEQGRIKHGLTPYRYGRDVVHRLVNARIGVEIGPEFHAHALAPRYDTRRLTVTPEVRGAIESHVFQEVGQSTLPGFLQDGAHPLGNVEVGNARLLGIVADIVGKPVLQRSRQERGVPLQRLGRDTKGEQQEEQWP